MRRKRQYFPFIATVPAGSKTGTVPVVTSTGTLNSTPEFVVTK
jgi:hypothetical protein